MTPVCTTKVLLASLLTIALLSACGHHQVPLSVVEESLPQLAHSQGLPQIGERLTQILAQRGWKCVPRSPERLLCSLDKKGHGVDIEILYSKYAYSIHLLKSYNMKQARGLIHKSYNSWVKYIIKDIRKYF